MLSGRTVVAKDNMADDSIGSATKIFGSKVAAGSGVETNIYFCGYTNAHNLRIIARQDTSNVGSWIGSFTVAYGGATNTETSNTFVGNVTNIDAVYNNGGSPSYTIGVTVTYTGSAPTIYWYADGIFGQSEPYAL